MTQITQFLLVVVGVAVAALWALLRKRSGRWFLLIVGAFVAWLMLPSVILQVKWGYYEENGAAMPDLTRNAFKAVSYYWAKQDGPLAAQVCGNPEGFEADDPSLQWVTMPEQAVVKHFFFYSKYSNVVWLGLGWKDRFCLARYLVVSRNDGFLHPWPTQLIPYPFFPWLPLTNRLEERLIERLPPAPKAPEGVRSILPGQCMTGEIAKGDTLRFQVQMPYFGQKIGLDVDLECIYEKNYPGLVQWTKNGRAIIGLIDDSDGGGTYQIELHAPATEAKRYAVGVFWGVERLRCPLPKSWWDKCRRRIVDPNATDGNPN